MSQPFDDIRALFHQFPPPDDAAAEAARTAGLILAPWPGLRPGSRAGGARHA